MTNKFLGMLGIATKAGATKSGAWAAEDAIRSGKAHLVIVATDASDSTKKGYKEMAATFALKHIECCTKEELGRACGKDERAVVAVTDENLSNTLLSKLTLSGED